jgi:hypothetical protein
MVQIQEVEMRTAVMTIAAALLACGGSKPGPAARTENYFPMAVGYEWKYSTTEVSYSSVSDGESARVETTANASNTEYRCVGRVPVPDGREAWVLQRHVRYNVKTERTSFAKDTATYTDTIYANLADSLVLLSRKRLLDRPSTELVLPLRFGRTWNVRAGELAPTWAKAVRQEPVNVPAGDYATAWRVEDSTVIAGGKMMPARSVRWYADGVGLVRREKQSTRGGRPCWLVIDELVSAKTGK